jgi:hypothetical protein
VRLGSQIPTSLLYGLSWILICVSGLMAVLGILTFLGFATLPISVRADLIGAAICSALGLLFRFTAYRFEHAAYLS